jgi:hypothetical protein
MDAPIHEKLTNLVHELGRGLAPKKRPTINGTIQRAVERLIDKYPGDASTSTEKPEVQAITPPESHPAHAVLAEILAHGTEEDIRRVTAMLDICAPEAVVKKKVQGG